MRDERDERRRRWGRLKAFFGVVIVAFAVTLALVVGNRLSDEALGVLAGAVCGVGAAIPTSLIVVAVTLRLGSSTRSFGQGLRRGESRSFSDSMPHQGVYPPVVVVSPQTGQLRSQDWHTPPSSMMAPMERNFTVVGGESFDRGGIRYDDERRS